MFIPKLVLLLRDLIVSLDEDFKTLRRTVSHCWNLTEGKGRFKPNLLLGRLNGEARGHACHAVHDQGCSEIKILVMKFHGQNAHKTKSNVL